jgi:hypothetical protein
MEEMLGRDLQRGEIVHHINGNKEDNDRSNLFLCADERAHRLAHMSVERLLPVLLERGIVCFIPDRGVYELCETDKSQPVYGSGVDSAVD